MSQIKVSYRFIKMAPRKVRLIADLVRNKNAQWAVEQLMLLNKSAAKPVLELLNSGIVAAKDKELNQDILYIKEIKVNEGPKLKRQRFNSRARASMVIKRMSHLILILSDEENKDIERIKKGSKKSNKISTAKGAKNGSKSKSS
ncbi:MAG: 50S ribosomal protein L22 [Patescibacteria group bacterium]|nr:50S ribosomal protein L22 [Patescibacteria group bacterium]